ncbi:ASKHA domain-containing protein [Treponema sp. TIM-1]|uniref:ASKHA domain-containing protein n=1 Tax=Treponema sp. TIM-1 TaxID=2898417 RepID=UPI00397FCD06
MTIRIEGREGSYRAEEGESLLDTLRRGGISMDAPCGGHGRCGKCRVRILSGSFKRVGGTKDLSADAGWLRACTVYPSSDLTIDLPQALFAGEAADNPADVSPVTGKTIGRAGFALDIGTTTVFLRLLDLDTGEALDTLSALNDQRIYGADVMSRISAAREGKTEALFRRINSQVRDMLSRFEHTWDLKKKECLAVAGNTTMLHLFVNADPSPLGAVPFTPVFLAARELPGSSLSLPVETAVLLPSISAFVGADISAGIAATGMMEADKISLLIDIGTNGEIALFHKGKLFCCSTAAGPALEGAGISCGTGGIAGAVNRIEKRDGSLCFSTISGSPPVGICGSGLVDAIAVMLEEGVIDETGAFTGDEASFPITDGIAITRGDVRQFQLAKSAIISGIKILCKAAGLTVDAVEQVYLAGGLGFYISLDSAIRTGLLPPCFRDRSAVCGNTSLEGAARRLTDPVFPALCNDIITKSVTVELTADPAFMEEFAENMLFPEM